MKLPMVSSDKKGIVFVPLARGRLNHNGDKLPTFISGIELNGESVVNPV